MANLPYITANPNKIFSALKMYSRAGNFPLDPTSVFDTKADAEAYIAEDGSYAYAGQVLAVANGTMAAAGATDDGVDFTLYVIRKDMSLQEIGRDLVFDSMELAQAYVTLNSDYVKPGTAVSIATEDASDYDLYLITQSKSLSKVSFDASTDIPEMNWSNITGKPTSAVTDIDAAVTLYQKFTEATEAGTISYNGKVLAYVEDLTWDKIQNKPDFATLYAAKEHTHAAADIGSLNFDDMEITGTLPLDAIPSGAKEEVLTASNLEELASPTWLEGKNVDKNDWIHVASVQDSTTGTSSAKMYYITDPTKLGTADYANGISEIPLGTAAAVDWSNVTNKPSFDTLYVKTADTVTSASVENAGKVLKIGADGKLAASITGDAATLNGKADTAFAAASHTHEAADLGDIPFSKITSTPNNLSGYGITDAVNTADVIEASGGATSAGKILKLNGDGKLAASITGDAATLESHPASYFATADHTHAATDITSLPWTKITDAPTTLNGYGITDAVNVADVIAASAGTASAGKILKLNDDGKLAADITGDAQTLGGNAASYYAAATHNHALGDLTGTLDWTKLTSATIPTTLNGYGITDAVASSDVVTAAEANKILKLDGDGKLPADITGDAATVGGKAASEFASATHQHAISEITNLQTTIDGIIGSADNGSSITHIDLGNTTFIGKISLDNMPAGALERMKIVESQEAMLALTQDDVQNGDLVKINATDPAQQKVYYVKDDTKLNILDGYELFPMGTAASVPWSGVTDKPDFASLYAAKDHTHTAADVGAVPAADAVATATANKLLYLDENGKLPASITGDAATLNGHSDTYFAQASHTHAHTDITDFDTEVNALISTAMATVGHIVVGTDAPDVASDIGANNMYIQLI